MDSIKDQMKDYRKQFRSAMSRYHKMVDKIHLEKDTKKQKVLIEKAKVLSEKWESIINDYCKTFGQYRAGESITFINHKNEIVTETVLLVSADIHNLNLKKSRYVEFNNRIIYTTTNYSNIFENEVIK